MIAGSLVRHATMFATPIWPPDETGKRYIRSFGRE